MKTVLFFVSEFPTISETFILNQITGLIDRGFKVSIYAYRSGNKEKTHKNVKKYSLASKTRYAKMPKSKFQCVVKGIYLLVKNLRHSPFKVLSTINFFKYGKRALSLRLLYMGTTIVKHKEKPDIIYAHFGPNGVIATDLKEIGLINAKIITSFHGYDMSTAIIDNDKGVYEKLFAKGDIFLPISVFWQKKLIQLGAPKDKVMVHHMGIDLGKFTFKERIYSSPLRIVSVCRLVEKKGLEYAINGLKILKETNKTAFFYTIVGDGPLRKKLENLVVNNNLKNEIKFVGWMNSEEITKILNKNDIFLAPSCKSANGDMEGIPVSIMEAMAKGLIVISTKHSGIPELVENKKNGILVSEKNAEEISKAIKYLVNHKKKWPFYSKNARKKIYKNFNIDQLNDKLVNIINEVLKIKNSKIDRVNTTK